MSKAVTAPSPAPLLQSPVLPPLLATATDDPYGWPATRWSEPSPSECRALAPRIPAALASLRAALEPAPREVMIQCLGQLALGCAPRPGAAETETTWKARHGEYIRMLSHYPADIWARARDEWMRQPPDKGNWYPTIAELNALMQWALDERKRRIERLEKIAALAKAPKPEDVPKRYSDLTPEQRAEHDRMMAEFRARFPDRPSEPVLKRDRPPARYLRDSGRPETAAEHQEGEAETA